MYRMKIACTDKVSFGLVLILVKNIGVLLTCLQRFD